MYYFRRITLSLLLSASLAFPALSVGAEVKNLPAGDGAANAQPLSGVKRPMRALDLFDLESAQDPQISPDGRSVVYVRRSADIMTDRYRSQIWLIDVASGEQRALITGDASYTSPLWSPDGTKLLYAVQGSGLYVMRLDDRSSYQLLDSNIGAFSPSWSKDGRHILFMRSLPDDAPRLATPPARPDGAKWAPPVRLYDRIDVHMDGAGFVEPRTSQIFTIPIDGGTARQISHDIGGYNSARWLDSRTVLATANHRDDADLDPRESDIFAIDLATGASRALTSRRGPDNSPAASPDGSKIAYTGYDDRIVSWQRDDLYVMNRDGSGVRNLTASLDRSVSSPVWEADGAHILVMVENEGRTELMRVSLNGTRTVLATDLGSFGGRPYAGGDFSVSSRKGGSVIAYTQGATDRPPEVAVLTSGGKARRLTDLNSDVLSAIALPETRKLPVRNAKDDLAIDAWMAIPPTARPQAGYPMILEIHGGPATMYGPSFATEIQRYAAEGYLTVWANQRGSLGYGEKFALSIDRQFPGQDDLGDIMAAVDAAIATGLVDPSRVYITGGSAGGTMTAWSVAHSDRFAAAAAVNPVINWTSVMLAGDTATHVARHQIRAMPWENSELFWSLSPLSKVGNVKTPTLLMVGDEDWRAPPFEAEQFYTALKLRGVDSMLARIPEASHGIGVRPSQQITKTDTIIAWFRRHDPLTQSRSPSTPTAN
ncbi:MAG: S9 family peptidase [Sphingobium sp.]|nr:S9 family peptidase [Sphingobium sp.]